MSFLFGRACLACCWSCGLDGSLVKSESCLELCWPYREGGPLSAGLAELVICELEVGDDGFSSYWERPLEGLINTEESDSVPACGPGDPSISCLTNVVNRLFFIRSSEIGFLPLEICFSILELLFSKEVYGNSALLLRIFILMSCRRQS